MATIHNSDVFKEIRDGARIQQLSEVIPSQIADKVVPVMEVNPKMLKYVNIVQRASSAATGTTAVYTTPTNAEFYLTSIMLSFSATVTNDQVGLYLSAFPFQTLTAVRLLDINVVTLVAQSQTFQKDYTYPIKIEKGTAINLVKAYAAGAGVYSCTICGYTIENPNT